MTCDTFREDMLDVLYGEAEPDTARRFEEHHDHCQACRQELKDLRGVRKDLASWSLPVPAPLRVPGRRPSPTALLLAATIVLSVGGSALVSRWATAPAERPDLAALLAAQETRHRQDMTEIRAALESPRRAAPVSSTPGEEALLRRVEELLQASESRQNLVLQARLADLASRTEAQRRYDLAQMSAGLTYLDGKTGLQAARTTELVGHILQASQKR